MILARLDDPLLCTALRGAALPEEDVLFGEAEVRDALQRGFARLLVMSAPPTGRTAFLGPRMTGSVPVVEIGGDVTGGIDRHAPTRVNLERTTLRLAGIVRDAAWEVPWIEATFRDLTRAAGSRLPSPFRGFARRVLDYPARYAARYPTVGGGQLSRDAVRLRFQRRGLPSPYTYLRWLRLLAVAHVLSDADTSTDRAAFRLGFTSGGNLCRTVRTTAGASTTRLRTSEGRAGLLAAFAASCLRPPALEAWSSLDELFLVAVA